MVNYGKVFYATLIDGHFMYEELASSDGSAEGGTPNRDS